MLGFKKLIMHFFHSLFISFGTDKEYLFSDQTVNPPNPPPPNISFFILYTLLYSFPLVLTWRICLAIKAVNPSPTPPPPPPHISFVTDKEYLFSNQSLFGWQSFPSISWSWWMIKQYYSKGKLDDGHSWDVNG